LPREAPCQEVARIVTATARSKPGHKNNGRAIMVAEHRNMKHGKTPDGQGVRRSKGGKGAIQLAASSKKKERRRKTSRR
jgi:hypothetical protein